MEGTEKHGENYVLSSRDDFHWVRCYIESNMREQRVNHYGACFLTADTRDFSFSKMGKK